MRELHHQEPYFPGAVFAGPAYREGAVDVRVNAALSVERYEQCGADGYAPVET
jgi:hypothetical protein